MALVKKTASGVIKSTGGTALKDLKDKNGNPLPKKLNFEFSWFEYDDDDSFVAAKEELSIAKQRKVVNDARKTKARQAGNTACLEAAGYVKPTEENDSQIRLKNVASGFYGKYISEGMSPEDARTKSRLKAAEMLEEDWDEDEDED